MSSGYSIRILEAIKQADARKPGVRLGLLCVHNEVPAAVVAKALGVSRTTVYNWFSGAGNPSSQVLPLVERYIANLSK